MINKSKDIKYIRNQLTREGYKFTNQREQIIETIYENNMHMNADEIQSKVKNKSIGISTIYRNLIILEEVGVLKKINITNTSYYELDKSGKHKVQIHAKCVKCNKIIDINEEAISESLDSLIEKSKKKINVKSASIVLSGVCKECEMKI